MQQSNETDALNLKPYVMRFAWVFALASLCIGLVAGLLDYFFSIDVPSAVVNIVSIMAAVSDVSRIFVGQQQRVFTQRERKYMTLASFAVSLLVSVAFAVIASIAFYLYFGVSLLSALHLETLFSASGMAIFLGVMLFFCVLSLLYIYWTYGSMPKQYLTALQKKK